MFYECSHKGEEKPAELINTGKELLALASLGESVGGLSWCGYEYPTFRKQI